MFEIHNFSSIANIVGTPHDVIRMEKGHVLHPLIISQDLFPAKTLRRHSLLHAVRKLTS